MYKLFFWLFAGVQTKKDTTSVGIQCSLLTDTTQLTGNTTAMAVPEVISDSESDNEHSDDVSEYDVEEGSLSEDDMDAVHPTDRVINIPRPTPEEDTKYIVLKQNSWICSASVHSVENLHVE